jgi:hypothetical protein
MPGGAFRFRRFHSARQAVLPASVPFFRRLSDTIARTKIDCVHFRNSTHGENMADDVTLLAAEKVLQATAKKAQELKVSMDIAVIDAGAI